MDEPENGENGLSRYCKFGIRAKGVRANAQDHLRSSFGSASAPDRRDDGGSELPQPANSRFRESRAITELRAHLTRDNAFAELPWGKCPLSLSSRVQSFKSSGIGVGVRGFEARR